MCIRDSNQDDAAVDRIVADETPLPYPFKSGDELLAQCQRSGLSIAALMFENEKACLLYTSRCV